MKEAKSVDLSPAIPDGIGVQRTEHLAARIVGYCTHPNSGWHTYTMLGAKARKLGHFNEIAPWSLLWAVALAGQLSVSDIAGFTHEFRRKLVDRLGSLPADDLANMSDDGLEALTLLCQSGFHGVRTPKMTKMLALYRPDAVPVLDGHVATAMGFARTGYSVGDEPRAERIRQTLLTLRSILREQHGELATIRRMVADVIPDIREATDVRLLDMLIWTSQDDRISRPGSPVNYWLNRQGHDYRSLPLDPLALP